MRRTPPVAEDPELALLLDDILQRYHHDFRDYAPASLRRRLAAAAGRLGCDGLAALRARLARDETLFAHLLEAMTVQVSEMFRDPAYYLALRRQAVPVLHTFASLKLWVAGCSTGEEAWSLAILLREEGLLERALIYATDINPWALRVAEAGIYPEERMAGFTESHRLAGGHGSLSEHYTAAYGRARLDPALRRHLVFSDHSLATDQVFSEVQLVSCRNVLIYFNRRLQDRALGLFADALCHHGFLGLGAKETVRFTSHEAVFEPCDAAARLYRKRG